MAIVLKSGLIDESLINDSWASSVAIKASIIFALSKIDEFVSQPT